MAECLSLCGSVLEHAAQTGTLIRQAAGVIMHAAPADLGPGRGDIIRDELR